MSNKSRLHDLVYDRLKTVMDPELDIDIVSLGLIYRVTVTKRQTSQGEKPYVHILMTLTTPGCPLAGVFDKMVKESLVKIKNLDPEHDVEVELTFDPPWTEDMMDPEARASLEVFG